MHEFADYVKQKYGSCAVARESTGNGGQITLEEEGTPAVLGNPCRAGLMANSSIKTDKIGARAPTTLLRLRRIKSVN